MIMNHIVIIVSFIVAFYGLIHFTLSFIGAKNINDFNDFIFTFPLTWKVLGYVVMGILLYIMYYYNILDSREWFFEEVKYIK